MTDPNYTALLFVIDRSGSMSGIRDDMVGGLETLLQEQIIEPGMLTVDVITFDTVIEHTHTMADPRAVDIQLDPRGGTALHDALGYGINVFGQQLAALPEHARPETVEVVVVTDGEENSSTEYSASTVRALIEQQRDQYGWDFVFLGANQDAVLTAAELGIDAGSAMDWVAAPAAVAGASRSTSAYLSRARRRERSAFTAAERDESRRESD